LEILEGKFTAAPHNTQRVRLGYPIVLLSRIIPRVGSLQFSVEIRGVGAGKRSCRRVKSKTKRKIGRREVYMVAESGADPDSRAVSPPFPRFH
jgi:hypothetical protein